MMSTDRRHIAALTKSGKGRAKGGKSGRAKRRALRAKAEERGER